MKIFSLSPLKWVSGVILLCLILLSFTIFIDARKISGIKFEQTSETELRATLRGQRYIIRYRPRESLTTFFGKAVSEFGTHFALVRDDLPKTAQKFVMYHEIYHLQDQKHKNVISREIHANLSAIPYSPLGFLQIVFLTLSDSDRIKYYLRLVF